MPEVFKVYERAYSSALEFYEGIDDDYDCEDEKEPYGGGGGSRNIPFYSHRILEGSNQDSA